MCPRFLDEAFKMGATWFRRGLLAEEVFAVGDKVATRWTAKGTNDRETMAPAGDRREIEGQTLLERAATLEDVGPAVFAASDCARPMTAAIVNVSCSALID
jgi:hypothetical protein